MSGKRGQGAFEYILLLAGVLLIVVLVIVILKSVILSPANANIQGTNEILNTVSQIPEVPGVWTKYNCSNPVISNAVDANQVVNVVKANGVYYGFYGTSGSGASSIGLLNSTDGINWQVENNSILTPTAGTGFDNFSIGFPSVIYDNGKFEMWYMATQVGGVGMNSWSQDQGESVGYAYSTDAVHWTRNANAVLTPGSGSSWDNYSIAPIIAVIKDGGVYKMWYDGSNTSFSGGDSNPSIGYATSTDGVNWQKFNGNGGPVITGIAFPGAVLKSSFYYLSLGVLSAGSFASASVNSTDGINWGSQAITLNVSTSPCSDTVQSIISSIILSNGQYQAWYDGGGSTGVFYATAPVNILTS